MNHNGNINKMDVKKYVNNDMKAQKRGGWGKFNKNNNLVGEK